MCLLFLIPVRTLVVFLAVRIVVIFIISFVFCLSSLSCVWLFSSRVLMLNTSVCVQYGRHNDGDEELDEK